MIIIAIIITIILIIIIIIIIMIMSPWAYFWKTFAYEIWGCYFSFFFLVEGRGWIISHNSTVFEKAY